MSLIPKVIEENEVEITITNGSTMDDKLIFCDFSGNTFLNEMTLNIQNMSNLANRVQRFSIVFNNDGGHNVNAKINILKINNINITILLNERDPVDTIGQIHKQEFILTNDDQYNYVAISTLMKYI